MDTYSTVTLLEVLHFFFNFYFFPFRHSFLNKHNYFQHSHICHCPKVISEQTVSQTEWHVRMENVSLTGKTTPELTCYTQTQCTNTKNIKKKHFCLALKKKVAVCVFLYKRAKDKRSKRPEFE